tara:strand:+ start:43 stop:411 length:369 start_codon:yes stop_codon:yes gene_type:complete
MKDVLYVKIRDDRKYVLGKDKLNWVWGNGTLQQTEERILSKKDTCYYTSMESMLVNLFEKRFREHVTEFTLANFKESLSKAEQEIRKIGKKLDEINWGVLDRGAYCPKCNSTIREIHNGTKQ